MPHRIANISGHIIDFGVLLTSTSIGITTGFDFSDMGTALAGLAAVLIAIGRLAAYVGDYLCKYEDARRKRLETNAEYSEERE